MDMVTKGDLLGVDRWFSQFYKQQAILQQRCVLEPLSFELRLVLRPFSKDMPKMDWTLIIEQVSARLTEVETARHDCPGFMVTCRCGRLWAVLL